MVEVVRYSDRYKLEWDAFVHASKNGTFMLLRDYIEYHADRFKDHSLLFYHKDKLIAVLPANAAEGELHSHAGLSYGGIVSGRNMKAPLMLQLFDALVAYCREQGFKRLYYKAIPHIYHQLPAEEDLYALFRSGAVLYRRDLNSVISCERSTHYSKDRRWRLSQAKRNEFAICQTETFTPFMKLVEEQLQVKYNLKPVHTAGEIIKLAKLFPGNIQLYTAHIEGEIAAGAILYETPQVAHAQYIGSSAKGSALGASSVLIDHLLTEVYPHKKYFSFGVSTEQQGLYLNEGLVRNKESYGARTVVHDFYRLDF